MAYQYKRRRPSIIRNFWVYRRLIGTAILLGLMLWFIWANDDPVTVAFPFGLGKLTSTTGIVILLSALVGSVMTILVTTVIFAIRRLRSAHGPARPAQPDRRGRRPPPAGLCGQNDRRLSQCSLVELTKKDDGNPLLILDSNAIGAAIVSPGPMPLPVSDSLAESSPGRARLLSRPSHRTAEGGPHDPVVVRGAGDRCSGCSGRPRSSPAARRWAS